MRIWQTRAIEGYANISWYRTVFTTVHNWAFTSGNISEALLLH